MEIESAEVVAKASRVTTFAAFHQTLGDNPSDGSKAQPGTVASLPNWLRAEPLETLGYRLHKLPPQECRAAAKLFVGATTALDPEYKTQKLIALENVAKDGSKIALGLHTRRVAKEAAFAGEPVEDIMFRQGPKQVDRYILEMTAVSGVAGDKVRDRKAPVETTAKEHGIRGEAARQGLERIAAEAAATGMAQGRPVVEIVPERETMAKDAAGKWRPRELFIPL